MIAYRNTSPLCGDTLIYDGGYIQCQDPACGWNKPTSLDISRSKILKDLPIWVFHGAKDDIVPKEESKKMVSTLIDCGNDVKFTVYPDVGHDSWVRAYEDPELYQWFLSKVNNQF